MKIPKTQIFIFLASFALTILLGLLLLPSDKKPENKYFRQSYDFRKLRLNNSDIDTLKIGGKLELANIKDAHGNALSSFSNEKLFLLVAADPFCPACNFSKDMMKEIRDVADNLKIPYFPISVSQTSASVEMENYSRSVGFYNYLYWSAESSSHLPLSQTITPTHILIDEKGTVIQAWYGSNKNEDVRKTMSNQISDDLLLVSDVFEAMAGSKTKN